MYGNNENNSKMGAILGNLSSQPQQFNTHTLNTLANNEFDNMGEDMLMMNIPREGNADLINKSTKLTLSSKK